MNRGFTSCSFCFDFVCCVVEHEREERKYDHDNQIREPVTKLKGWLLIIVSKENAEDDSCNNKCS